MLEEKNCQRRILYTAKTSFKSNEEIVIGCMVTDGSYTCGEQSTMGKLVDSHYIVHLKLM